MTYSIDDIRSNVSALAKEYGAQRIWLFGSYARGEAKDGSDIDLRIDKGNIRGWKLGGLLADLEESLGVPVDLCTTASLDEGFLKQYVTRRFYFMKPLEDNQINNTVVKPYR